MAEKGLARRTTRNVAESNPKPIFVLYLIPAPTIFDAESELVANRHRRTHGCSIRPAPDPYNPPLSKVALSVLQE